MRYVLRSDLANKVLLTVEITAGDWLFIKRAYAEGVELPMSEPDRRTQSSDTDVWNSGRTTINFPLSPFAD